MFFSRCNARAYLLVYIKIVALVIYSFLTVIVYTKIINKSEE